MRPALRGRLAGPVARNGANLTMLTLWHPGDYRNAVSPLPAASHGSPFRRRMHGYCVDRLAGPEVVTVDAAPAGAGATTRYYEAPYRSDSFEITATDAYGCSGSSNYSITATCPTNTGQPSVATARRS